MKTYHKIQTVFDRDPETKHKTLIYGQWATEAFAYLHGLTWTYTEKVDGTNIRIGMDDDGAKHVGGRTDKAQIPNFLLDRLAQITPKLSDVFDGEAVVYGEGYGAKIQKGGGNYKPDGVDFVVFDVCVGGLFLRRADVVDVAGKLGLIAVPIVGSGTLSHAASMCRDGFQSAWGDFPAEGLVMRPQTELHDRRGARVIAKVKCRDFV